MDHVTIHVHEVHQTGGDHVGIFDADVLRFAHDLTIDVTLAGVHPAYDRSPEDERLAIDNIREGATAVLAPAAWGR